MSLLSNRLIKGPCFSESAQLPLGRARVVRVGTDLNQLLVFSGSSAALLSREIATAMRGRAWEVVIHPFSFEEALRHRGQVGW